jgi:primary-amine oxidase
VAALLALPPGEASAAAHPLDELSAEELQAAVAVLKAAGKIDEASRFASLILEEPAKAEVRAWKPGQRFSRRAQAVVKQGPKTFEAVVDLDAKAVASFAEVEGVQAGILFEEWEAAQAVTVADPGWLAAMAKRGYAAEGLAERVFCAPLSPGYFALPELEGRRVLNVQCFDRQGSTTNVYGRPIEGLTAVVDLNERRVVRLVEEGVVPVPGDPLNYDEASVAPLQPLPKPTSLHQPQGTNIELDGQVVRWGPWSFHLRLDRRRGAIVSLARFDDKGRERDVMYQGSLSEVFVPYQDPAPGWAYKTYLDAGEYGFGLLSSALRAGVDCPATAVFTGGTIAIDDGVGAPYENVFCLFERSAGDVAWRHSEFLNETYEGRAKVDLVVRSIATVGNYDYVVDWTFTKGGAIGVEVGATGIDILKGVRSRSMSDPTAAEDTAYGTLVAPGVVAPNHDHFFSFRLDLDVDGPRNMFAAGELKTKTLPAGSARRSVWTHESRMPMTEKQAQLTLSYERPAVWHVMSSDAKNAVGNPTSYMLAPKGNAISLLLPEDWPQKRAAFSGKHLWVTPYAPDELYAGGDYPNQSKGDDGLAVWTERDRPIHDTDVVLWYTLGFHHVPASEDLPVLGTHPSGFSLMPMNFFDRNPQINLAKPRSVAGGGVAVVPPSPAERWERG